MAQTNTGREAAAGQPTPDASNILALARDKSIAGREALASSLAGMVRERGAGFSPEEEALSSDILRTLIRDVERSVRAALAANLAATAAAPRDVIIALANDDIEVAFPVLAESPLLQDEDLIEIVKQQATGHRIAVAMRPALSEDVSDSVIASKDDEAVICLLHNNQARIRPATMEALVDEAEGRQALHAPLAGRLDLTPALATKLANVVSAILQRQLAKQYALNPAHLSRAAGAAAEDAIAELTAKDDDFDNSPQRRDVRQMIEILRRQEWPQFEAAMVRFAGLQPSLTHAILAERDGRRLTALCRARGVHKSDFASLFLLSRKATPDAEVVDADDVRDALQLFDSIEREAADRAVRRWYAKEEQSTKKSFG